jgi:5-methylcytosine-specific restriction endonuclease McrA
MLSIKEQYEHPHWQRKRLEIFRRDGWECRCCGATNKQLHVHHLYYENDLHVWEYDNEALATVCDKCHKLLHSELKKLSGIVAFKMLSGEIDITDL